MFAFLSNFFIKKGIELFAATPLPSCKVIKPYLLEQYAIERGTVIMIAVPYLTSHALASDRNISAYAVSKDYHLFFNNLFHELLPILKSSFPSNRFCAFSDHSPIDEVDAAAKAGLGIKGKNNLLITQKFSSFVFLGEIITDAILPSIMNEVEHCEACGLCEKLCPKKECGTCLSQLSQKKGELNDKEATALINYNTAWGCDICQNVCPHTKAAIQAGTIFSPIPFFCEDPIPRLTVQAIGEMSDSDFSLRAYHWRKKETILRNLKILEATKKKGEQTC